MIPVPWHKRIVLVRRRLCLYPAPEPMRRSRLFWVTSCLVSLAVIIFCVYFITLLTARYDAFQLNAEDLGIMDQALWNTVHGHFLRQTICNIVYDTNCGPTPEGIVRFAIHFEPLLVPISLIYFVWSNPKILLVLQTLVVASGAFPAFWLARLRLRNELAAVLIALLYLLYPAQQQALVFDFHAVTLTAAFLLYLLYFMYTCRTTWMFVFALLAMMCKEEIPLVVAMFGLWSAIFQMRRSGWVLFGIGLVWFFLAMKVIIPHFSPTGQPLLSSRYGQLDSPVDFLQFVLRHPKGFFQQYIWEPDRRAYLVVLLSPALYLPLLAPWIFFMALPSLSINLLSSNPSMYSGLFHYNAEIVPVLIFSTIEALLLICWLTGVFVVGLRTLLARAPSMNDIGIGTAIPSSHLGHVASTVLLVGLLGGVLWSSLYTNYYFHGQLPYSRDFSWPYTTARLQLTQRFIDRIPPTASVSTQNKLVPHLSHREHIYYFPYAEDLADYILLDIYTDLYPFDSTTFMSEVQKVIMSGHYGIVAAQDGLLLLQRGLPSPGLSSGSPAQSVTGADPTQVLLNLPASFCSNIYVASQQAAKLPHPLKADFTTPAEEAVRLVGFQVNAPETFDISESTLSFSTYWQVSSPLTTPLRLALLLWGDDGQVFFSSTDFAQLSWCPPTLWQPDNIVRISSVTYSLEGIKVPKGLAHMSIALLPLVQSSSTIMNVQARLPLHVIDAPDFVSADYSTRALQLMSLNMTD